MRFSLHASELPCSWPPRAFAASIPTCTCKQPMTLKVIVHMSLLSRSCTHLNPLCALAQRSRCLHVQHHAQRRHPTALLQCTKRMLAVARFLHGNLGHVMMLFGTHSRRRLFRNQFQVLTPTRGLCIFARTMIMISVALVAGSSLLSYPVLLSCHRVMMPNGLRREVGPRKTHAFALPLPSPHIGTDLQASPHACG